MISRENSKGSALFRLMLWAMLAAVAVFAFSGAILKQKQRARERSFLFLAASPEQGRVVFGAKGCIRCHSVNGDGGKVGPDLGRKNSASSLSKLITGMWNHAPTMWERMRSDGVAYPDLGYEDVAQLMAYLYMARHVDAPGDPANGRAVFASKRCNSCHSSTMANGASGPELAITVNLDGTLGWSASLWNHAPKMLLASERQKIEWPQFHGAELRDLYAFTSPTATAVPLGDPERGWRLFQQKSCAGCHSIRGTYQLQGPNLGPEQPLPSTLSELSGVMLTHFPKMEKAMSLQGMNAPALSAQEMADIFAFLYSLRYVEPSGSPQVGASVFGWRGCSRCHGANAEGTSRAPSLRGRSYNSITLGVVLWHHGQQMYAETRKLKYAWPTLAEEDIGDLLAFLNLPANEP